MILKVEDRVSSITWWRHAKFNNGRPNFDLRSVQQPAWKPVFEAVVSKQRLPTLTSEFGVINTELYNSKKYIGVCTKLVAIAKNYI